MKILNTIKNKSWQEKGKTPVSFNIAFTPLI